MNSRSQGQRQSLHGPLVGAIDQGTSSTRFVQLKTTELLSHYQVEIKQLFYKEGWVDEDPKQILTGFGDHCSIPISVRRNKLFD
uniref:Uncharacterized protein n=1 Tax=Poecilia reticulata TaxID=8081 RepID=A0A3P9PPD0_POERE